MQHIKSSKINPKLPINNSDLFSTVQLQAIAKEFCYMLKMRAKFLVVQTKMFSIASQRLQRKSRTNYN